MTVKRSAAKATAATSSVAIHTIVTHVMPHVDEILALFLLFVYGEKVFPGIANAKIVYWPAGAETLDGRPAQAWRNEGYLLIGVGGSEFDEHPNATEGRKREDCAATLVAKALGVADNAELQQLLGYVKLNDQTGKTTPYDLAKMVLALHAVHTDDPQKVLDWAFMAFRADIAGQTEFAAAGEDLGRAQIEQITGPRGESLRLIAMESNSPAASKYAFANAGGQADIVVVRRSNGQTAIMTRKGSGIILRDLIQMLRVEEQRLGHRLVRITDFKKLGEEGCIDQVPEWFYQQGAEWILNGGPRAPHIPPTKLSLESIIAFIRIAVNPKTFEASRSATCIEGRCNATSSKPCAFYSYGLSRCRTIRFQARQQG